MKKRFCFFYMLFISIVMIFSANLGFSAERTEIKIPDIPGYLTLKCDFHMHTVFSDGNVWPTVRPDEIWREGLDAFSITDHIEYMPHKEVIVKDYNESYNYAIDRANALNLIMIKGVEITREMPPGHFNAIFIKEVNPLYLLDYKALIKSFIDQGAFIFWNHPPDKWYDEHEELYKNGWLHGIEVVNGGLYYPHSQKWCNEKNLTLIGTSDVHEPMYLQKGQHRPMTLVFAKERSEQAIKEALIERRTVVYNDKNLIGDAKYLKPLFEESIKIVNPNVTIKGKGSANIWINNKSEVPFNLVLAGDVPEISAPKEINLIQDGTVLFRISRKSNEVKGKKDIKIPYKVTNLITAPEEYLPIEINISVTFED